MKIPISFLSWPKSALLHSLVLGLAIGAESHEAFASQETAPPVELITAEDEIPGAYFGYALASEGDLLAVGAPLDSERGTNAGAVYLYQRSSGEPTSWSLVKKLWAEDTGTDDNFGQAIALNQGRLAVGAPLNDTDDLLNSGAIYIFSQHEGGTNNWGQVQQFVPPDNQANNQFGISLDLDGDILVAGLPLDVTLPGNTGSAHVFQDSGGSDGFEHLRKLTSSDGIFGDAFGSAVAVSGDYIAIAAPFDDVPTANAGSVYLFFRDRGGRDRWGQLRRVIADDRGNFNTFGTSIDLEGSLLVVGAPFNSNDGEQTGSAYLFEAGEGGQDNWGQIGKLWYTNTVAGAQFGASIDLKDDHLLVGAPYDTGSEELSGAAYLFRRDQEVTNQWDFIRVVTATNALANDQFGLAVALAGTSLAVGTPLSDAACPEMADCNSGAIFVQSISDTQPPEVPVLNIGIQSDMVVISLQGGPLETWIIQSNTNLNTLLWTEAGTIDTDETGSGELTLPNLSTSPQTFYQAVSP